jgi:succinoglycan biosynthesis protein ExoO
MDIRFSVVIPVHNKERHVAAAIASALGQTHAPFEILVIDDCSTDRSAQIVADISDPRLRRFTRNVPGPGGYAARNLGITEAASDWIAFLDADDIWHPEHLADIAEAIAMLPEIGCVATRYEHVYATRRVPSTLTPILARAEGRAISFAEFLQIWVRNGECPIWTSASAFRRDVLQRAGPFPDGKALRGGDKDMWLRAARLAPFTYISHATAEFHREADNKVSLATNPDSVPVLVETARSMIESASGPERAMLRRLVNQQIGLYARFSFKGRQISRQFARNLYLPEGLGLFITIEAARLMPAPFRQRVYHLLKRA